MSRNCTVRNQTRRQVTFQGRSGRFRHLPPLTSIEIPEVEIVNNAFVEKLVKRRILAVVEGGKKETTKAASAPRDDQAGTAGKATKKPRASLSGLVEAKEASMRGDKDSDAATAEAEPSIDIGDADAGPEKGKKT